MSMFGSARAAIASSTHWAPSAGSAKLVVKAMELAAKP